MIREKKKKKNIEPEELASFRTNSETRTLVGIPGWLTACSLLLLSFVSCLFLECGWFGVSNGDLGHFGPMSLDFTCSLPLRAENRMNV